MSAKASTSKKDKDAASDIEGPDTQQRHLAARAVASLSHDAADCAELLGALGLTAADGLGLPRQRAADQPTDQSAK